LLGALAVVPFQSANYAISYLDAVASRTMTQRSTSFSPHLASSSSVQHPHQWKEVSDLSSPVDDGVKLHYAHCFSFGNPLCLTNVADEDTTRSLVKEKGAASGCSDKVAR